MVEEYMATGGAVGMMSPQPAIHRVVPAQSAVKSEWILPYDDVRAILLASKTFGSAIASVESSKSSSTTRAAFPKRSASTFPRWPALPRRTTFPARSARAFGQGRRGRAGSYRQQRDEGDRVRLQLLQLLLRDHARHHQYGIETRSPAPTITPSLTRTSAWRAAYASSDATFTRSRTRTASRW